ncbi:MAG: hypothetical protein RIC55_05500 [Pirellulaceae bacterium]
MTTGKSLEEAQRAKSEALRVFRQLIGEASVGIMPLGGGKFGLKVNLDAAPEKGVDLPREVEGVPVEVDVVGKIYKRD